MNYCTNQGLSLILGMCFASWPYALAAAESIPGVSAPLTDTDRCGPNSLQACLCLNDHCVSRSQISEVLPERDYDFNLLELKQAAAQLGCDTLAVKWSDMPASIPSPMIVPTVQRNGRRHFLVVAARSGDRVLILDVPNRPYWVPLSTFKSNFNWTGEALHVSRSSVAHLESLLMLRQRTAVSLVVLVMAGCGWQVFRAVPQTARGS